MSYQQAQKQFIGAVNLNGLIHPQNQQNNPLNPNDQGQKNGGNLFAQANWGQVISGGTNNLGNHPQQQQPISNIQAQEPEKNKAEEAVQKA